VLGAGLLVGGCHERGAYASSRQTETLEQDASGPSLLTSHALGPALAQIESKAGSLRSLQALELEIHPDRIVLQAQDPKHPEVVRQFEYRARTVTGPIKVKLEGPGKLEDNLFPLADAKLDAIPELAQQALHKIDAERGKVRFVRVRRNLPTDMELRFRVFVSSPRRDGQVDADHNGRIVDQT
jgi:hypothetical protein